MTINKSTGPRTEDGKRNSSMNALKHGLYAKSPQALEVITPVEADFDSIYLDMRRQYRPKDALETQLVRRIARCLWRLAKGEAMERRITQLRPDTNRPSISYEKVMRYERLVDLHLHRALAALERKQAMTRRVSAHS